MSDVNPRESPEQRSGASKVGNSNDGSVGTTSRCSPRQLTAVIQTLDEAVLLFSCTLAFLLNYTIFWNNVWQLEDFFTVGIGWVLFGGLPFDLLNVIGQGLGFLGSGLYAYCKIKGK